MTTQLQPETETPPRQQTLLLGGIAGALFGLVAAYFYSRATEEDIRSGGQGKRASVGEMISVALAALAIIRQIAELGRSPAKEK
jgi:hypothetical protein